MTETPQTETGRPPPGAGAGGAHPRRAAKGPPHRPAQGGGRRAPPPDHRRPPGRGGHRAADAGAEHPPPPDLRPPAAPPAAGPAPPPAGGHHPPRPGRPEGDLLRHRRPTRPRGPAPRARRPAERRHQRGPAGGGAHPVRRVPSCSPPTRCAPSSRSGRPAPNPPDVRGRPTWRPGLQPLHCTSKGKARAAARTARPGRRTQQPRSLGPVPGSGDLIAEQGRSHEALPACRQRPHSSCTGLLISTQALILLHREHHHAGLAASGRRPPPTPSRPPPATARRSAPAPLSRSRHVPSPLSPVDRADQSICPLARRASNDCRAWWRARCRERQSPGPGRSMACRRSERYRRRASRCCSCTPSGPDRPAVRAGTASSERRVT